MITSNDESPYGISYFNVLKQEFVSARFLLYESILTTHDKVHYSDKEVFLYNTLDYPIHCLNNEKIKMVFISIYSIFDKIGFFLNQYYDLGIPENKVSFRSIWFKTKNKKRILREQFSRHNNLALRGLFWLSKDLLEMNEDYKNAIEPDAQRLFIIRNHIAHKYLRVHDDFWNTNSNVNDIITGSVLAYSINKSELIAKTLKLIKITRNALIYLSLSIHHEEAMKLKELGENTITVPVNLDTWEDDWKLL